MLFEDKEIEGFANRMLDADKSIYDAIEVDSETERKFAAAFESRDGHQVLSEAACLVQDPNAASAPTIPDWALVKQEAESEPKLYLVRETKSTPAPVRPPQLRKR